MEFLAILPYLGQYERAQHSQEKWYWFRYHGVLLPPLGYPKHFNQVSQAIVEEDASVSSASTSSIVSGGGPGPIKIHQIARIIESLTNVAILVTHLHRLII